MYIFHGGSSAFPLFACVYQDFSEVGCVCVICVGMYVCINVHQDFSEVGCVCFMYVCMYVCIPGF